MNDRIRFLEHFLGALGAKKISWQSIESDGVQGIVIYDYAIQDEQQEFYWPISESEAPSEDVITLAKMIRDQNLLRGDRFFVDQDELRRRFSACSGQIIDVARFSQTLDALVNIRVPMLDDGIEGDYFFIHE